MAYLKPYDFIQLKAFFLALQQSHFNLSQVSSAVVLNRIRTPIDKVHCLTLLRSFPDLQGEKFKDDNSLIKYLSQPGNIQRILGQLPIDQQIELTKALVEKPAIAEVTGEQPTGQAVGEPVSTMAGQGPQMPNLPSATYTHPTPRIIRNAPTTSEKTTSFTDADQTAAVEEAQRIVTTKTTPGIKPSIPAPIINSAKNLSSTAQIFTRTNLGRIGRGLGDMVKGAGRAVGSPVLNGAYSGLGKAWNSGLRNLPNIPRPRLGGFGSTKLKGFGTGKKVALAFSLFGLFFGFSLIAGIVNPSTTPTSEASPISNGLNYTLPLKDPSVNPQDIRDQIKAAFPSAKLDYWDTVINTSKAAGINPALALALWVEETGASQTTVIRNGGSGIPNSDGKLSTGHLGCAPGEDQTINESLTCLIKVININNFTNDQFPEFMAKYSSGPPSDPFSNNPYFPNNFKYWYSKLVPTGAGAIQPITPSASYTPNGGAGIVSCPLNGAATITLGSKDAGGHCTPQYQAQEAPCLPGDPTGRGSAIDVQSSDKAIFLPTLGGQRTDWTVDTTGAINDGGTYVGQDLAATASYNGKTYRIRFVHLDSTQLTTGSHYPSGTFVGYYRTAQNHVHITLQEDGVFKDSDLYFNLCK